jgi:hypothetical protein
MKANMTSTTLRGILIAAVFIALAGASAGFYVGLGWIRSYTEEVNTVIIASAESGDTVSSINIIQEQLAKQQEIITAANSLFALSTNYQTQAITDIYRYADKTGITVTDIKFDETSAAQPSSSSLITRPITASLEGQVPYTNLLQFMKYIETSVPKIQIGSIDLSRPTDGSKNVSISSISLRMYVR